MSAALQDIRALQMAFSGVDAASAFSSTSTEAVSVERPEVAPPSTANPSWLMPTAMRIVELIFRHPGRRDEPRITRDTMNFALAVLAQSLPPTAPPPSISILAHSGINLQWNTKFGVLRLEVDGPNRARLINAETVVNARADLSELGELLWARLTSDPNETASGVTLPQPVPEGSGLDEAINKLLIDTKFDDGFAAQAQSAANDAKIFTKRELPRSHPHVAISDDGVVTLQWEDTTKGLLLVFVGDETVTYSIKKPGTSYSLNAREIQLSSALPEEAILVVRNIERG